MGVVENYTKRANQRANEAIRDYNRIVDKSTKNSTAKINKQIATLPQQYQSAFDINALQRMVNERQLEERMANLGLTDSGINRTQLTALNIQKQNTDAAYTQQKNNAINSLKSQIADIIAQAELNKEQYAMEIKQQTKQNIDSFADSYAAEQRSAARSYSSRQSNNSANLSKIKNSILNAMGKEYNVGSSDSTSNESDQYKMSLILDYVVNYDPEINEQTALNEDIKRWLSAANIDYSRWTEYAKRHGYVAF